METDWVAPVQLDVPPLQALFGVIYTSMQSTSLKAICKLEAHKGGYKIRTSSQLGRHSKVQSDKTIQTRKAEYAKIRL